MWGDAISIASSFVFRFVFCDWNHIPRAHAYLDLENMEDFFEKVWDYKAKDVTLWFAALLHVPWQEVLQENDVPLLHRRRGHYCVYHVWFLDPLNTRDFFERFLDYQAKYDSIVLKPELFHYCLKAWTEVWTIKNTPVPPECACWDYLDQTCGDACDCIITVWCWQRHSGCVWGMQATAASSVPGTAGSLVLVTRQRRGVLTVTRSAQWQPVPSQNILFNVGLKSILKIPGLVFILLLAFCTPLQWHCRGEGYYLVPSQNIGLKSIQDLYLSSLRLGRLKDLDWSSPTRPAPSDQVSWEQRAVYVSTVSTGHFLTLDILFYCLKFLYDSCRSQRTDLLDQSCTPYLKILHTSGHSQLNYVTINLVSSFVFAQSKLFFKKSSF